MFQLMAGSGYLTWGYGFISKQMKNIKKLISLIIVIISFSVIFEYVYAKGVSFGVPSAIKEKVEQLKEEQLLAVAEDTTAPVISNVSAGNITSSGATITWNTDELATSQVEYGLTTAYGTTYPTSDSSADKTSHSVALSGLSAGTLYHYRVISKDASGNTATGSDGTFTTSAGSGSHELPDTGQTTSYTDTFGEDSDYQPSAAQMSYTDNGDGTVTDNRTGLMWVKDGNSAGCNDGTTLTWEQALTFCEGLSYAGYSDWRLPNVRELDSIVKCEGPAPFINGTYFLNTVSDWYWTSTTYVPDTTRALAVYLDSGFLFSGTVTGVDKTFGNYVRPVRGGP